MKNQLILHDGDLSIFFTIQNGIYEVRQKIDTENCFQQYPGIQGFFRDEKIMDMLTCFKLLS